MYGPKRKKARNGIEMMKRKKANMGTEMMMKRKKAGMGRMMYVDGGMPQAKPN
tara:strand:- start:196 stop:354 length:159 start_codon:yes stop_codon:yes gene_type:complete